jgi:hypothetical protein
MTVFWAVFFMFTWPFFAVFFLVVLPLRFITKGAVELPVWQEWKARLQTNRLHKQVAAVTASVPSQQDFAGTVYKAILDDIDDAWATAFITAALEVYDMEDLSAEIPKPPAIANSIEAARYRDWLAKHAAKIANPRAAHVAQRVIIDAFRGFAVATPGDGGTDLTMPISQSDRLPQLVENLSMSFYDQEAIDLGVFNRLRTQLNRNLCHASGLPAIPDNYESAKLVMPSAYKGDNIVHTYLKGTPFLPLFNLTIGYDIPMAARYEGQWIVAPQGTGKTQFIQYQITRLIPRICKGKASAIIIDSQEEMIPKSRTSRRSKIVWCSLTQTTLSFRCRSTSFPSDKAKTSRP